MHSQISNHNFPQIESGAKILRDTNEDEAPNGSINLQNTRNDYGGLAIYFRNNVER